MSIGTAAFGGAVMGLGQGLFNRAENEQRDLEMKRKAAIESAQQIRMELMRQSGQQANTQLAGDIQWQNQSAFESNRAADERANQARRDQADRGLLFDVQQGDDNTMYGITRGHQKIDLGFKGAPRAPRVGDENAMAAKERDVWNRVVQRNSTVDDNTKIKSTDWQATASDFDAAARTASDRDQVDYAKLAQQARGSGTSSAPPVDIASERFRKAQQQAQAEADEKNPVGPDFMRPGAMKDAYGGKTEAQWVYDRAMEIAGSPGGAAAGGGGAAGTYKTPEDVGAAYKQGKITVDEATRILQDQFGLQ